MMQICNGFKIDGAVVMPDMKICGDRIRIPKLNTDYKVAIYNEDEETLWASKSMDDEFVLAISVTINNKSLNLNDIKKIFKKI